MNEKEKNFNETIEIFTDYIDSEGYVLRYNYEKGYYYNTGVCLKGSLGNPGRPGKPGKDGDSWDLRLVDGIYYWFKNGINTNIPAQTSGGGGLNVLSNWTQSNPNAPDFIKNKPTLFSGDYEDLTNKPIIPTDVSALTNDAGYVTSSELAAVATSGDYEDLDNKPNLFSGDYNDLTNKPSIPDSTSDLTNDSGFITSNDLAEVATSGSYNDLTDKPTLFSGNYNDLTNKPTIPSIWTGTQAEYDAIEIKDASTIYLIK